MRCAGLKRLTHAVLLMWVGALLAPCAGMAQAAAPEPATPPTASVGFDEDAWELTADAAVAAAERAQQVTRSELGMVVSAKPMASAAGAAMLARGGNAVDAAVATAFALTVVEPSMSSIGGRSQILIRTADGTFHGIDGGTEVPASFEASLRPPSSAGSMGYGTIAIPGTVAGLAYAQAEFGTLSLAEVLAPAISLARDGFPLTRGEAGRMASAARHLAEYQGAAMHFLKADGSPYRPGETFRQPQLAWVLEQIARDGPDAFYRGEIARLIAEDMRANGGFVTEADLAGYRARPNIVVHGSYRGHELVGIYFPASGTTLIQVLQMLEESGHAIEVDSPEWVSLLAQSIRIAAGDRRARLGSPEEKARTLTSRDWAKRRAAEIRPPRGTRPARREMEEAYESPDTTHLSAADRNGGMVAITQSIGPGFGSKVASPALGFMYASTMGYSSGRPGVRPTTSQSPFMVLKDGQPRYALGAAGAGRIISSQAIVLSRLLDGGQSLEQAMAGPRFHPMSQDRIRMEDRDEARWPARTRSTLEGYRFNVSTSSAPSYYGRIHALAYEPESGTWLGVADPRRQGAAIAPER